VVIKIESLIKFGKDFIRIQDYHEPIDNVSFLEGAIYLSIDNIVLLDEQLWDYVVQLWAYILDLIENKVLLWFFPLYLSQKCYFR
jgi:hypothetical protein